MKTYYSTIMHSNALDTRALMPDTGQCIRGQLDAMQLILVQRDDSSIQFTCPLHWRSLECNAADSSIKCIGGWLRCNVDES